jgi:hypothetical protein
LQVFGGDMTQDIIESVALQQKFLQDLFSILFILSKTMRFRGFQLKYAAICPGHYLLVDPISQPSADELFFFHVRSHRDPGEYAPDVDIVRDIQMTEYLGNAPFGRIRLKIELIVRQTKKGLGAGFREFNPI